MNAGRWNSPLVHPDQVSAQTGLVRVNPEAKTRPICRRNAFSGEVVREAQELFEKRLGRPISEIEVRNLLGNLTDWMSMLVMWELQAGQGPLQEDLAPPARKRGRPRKQAAIDV